MAAGSDGVLPRRAARDADPAQARPAIWHASGRHATTSTLLALVAAAAVSAVAAAQETAPEAVAPTSFPVQTVTVRGATLGYRDINPDAPGTPLVIINGYGFTMAEWHPTFIMTLAQNRGSSCSTTAASGARAARCAA